MDTVRDEIARCVKESVDVPQDLLVVADFQTKGRGRIASRSWESSKANNILASFVVKVGSPTEMVRANLGIAISIAQTARAFGLSAGVKWPNDVWVKGKKLAGILIDVSPVSGSDFVLNIGIGVNVNEHIAEIEEKDVQQSSCSFLSELGSEVSREHVLADILNAFEPLLDLSLADVIERYSELDVLRDKEVVVLPRRIEHAAEESYDAIARGLDASGYLRVQLKSSREIKSISSDEVSVRPFLEHFKP